MKLDGKVAIVTGGAMGIGKGIVSVFLKYGASVVILDNSDKLKDTILEFNQNGWHIGLARSNQDFDSDGSTAEKIVSIMPTYHILSIYEEDGKIIDSYSNSQTILTESYIISFNSTIKTIK